ncbi:MAG TPA: flagellar hook-associated protein FlgL [Verrucomicrobiae bacterium]
MRVSSNSFPDSLVDQLARLTARQNRLQMQAATGQRIQLPEDDPAAMQRVLQLQAESSSLAQYQQNIGSLKDTAVATYDLMKGLQTTSDRANEIAVLADGTKSPDDLKAYATQVTQLIKQAVAQANGQFHGNYLLGGTKNDQPPFVIATDANGNVTGVTYQGNTSLAENEIGKGVSLPVGTLGANTSGSGPTGLLADSRTGADFFNHLISLQNHLLAGDKDSINTIDRPQLVKDSDNIILQLSDNATVQGRLDATGASAKKQSDSLEGLISAQADADLAQTLVRLNQTQTAYQAALQSGAQLLSHSLLDYIR